MFQTTNQFKFTMVEDISAHISGGIFFGSPARSSMLRIPTA